MKTKAEQRIEIAKDVLKHLKANKITAECAVYFKPDNKGMFEGQQLKDILPKIKNCKVCALGGIFYSYVARHNNYQLNGGLGYRGLQNLDNEHRQMRSAMEMFQEKQLHLIEYAFEGRRIERFYDYSEDTQWNAITYRAKKGIKSDNAALKHIMNNIIKNKGTFKP